ncbi:hypothetical protein CHUAL_014200 [Chamberlinius hualienensis]
MNFYFIFVTLIIRLALFAANGKTEEIEFFPKQEIYQEGDKLTLTCTVNDAYICKWKRAGRTIDFEQEKRYKNNTESNCIIAIDPVRDDDDGKWKCQLIPINNTDSPSVTLIKRLIVDDHSFNTGAHLLPSYVSSAVVAEHEKVELQCLFNSSAPACFWIKDDEIVAIGGRYQYVGDKYEGDCSIEIRNVSYKDDGKWRCGYPKMDNWPLVKSTPTTLNVTVTPNRPVISVQGIAMEEAATIYYHSTTTSNRQYYSYNSKQTYFSNYQIFCWSENGNPAATITWRLTDLDDNPITQYTDSSTQNIWTIQGLRNLKMSSKQFVWERNKATVSQLHFLKLICEARHPHFVNNQSTTYIRVTWVDSSTSS